MVGLVGNKKGKKTEREREREIVLHTHQTVEIL
jgi:hypothetical protein